MRYAGLDYTAVWNLTWHEFVYLHGEVARYIYEYELPVRYKADPKQTVLKYLDVAQRVRLRRRETSARGAVTQVAKQSRSTYMKARNLRIMQRDEFAAKIAANKKVVNVGTPETTQGLRDLASFLGGKKK